MRNVTSMCFTATLEMDFTRLDWRLSERSELTVDGHAPSLTFRRDDFLYRQIVTLRLSPLSAQVSTGRSSKVPASPKSSERM